MVADNALFVSQAEKLTGMPQQRVYLRRRTAASFLTAPHAASRRPGAPTGRRVEARQAKVLTADEARRIDGANKVVVIEPPAPMQSSSTW